MKQDYYRVGQIINTHGLKGEVSVIPITDFPQERFKKNNKLYIIKNSYPIAVKIENARFQNNKNILLLKFAEFNNINQVECFKGMYIYVSSNDLNELKENEYYYHDIIGIKIVDKLGNNIGTVCDIISLKSNDVWVVQRKNKSDLLLPFIKSVMLNVDINNKIAIVEIPDGLINNEN